MVGHALFGNNRADGPDPLGHLSLRPRLHTSAESVTIRRLQGQHVGY